MSKKIVILTEATEGGVLRHITDLYTSFSEFSDIKIFLLLDFRRAHERALLKALDIPFTEVNTKNKKQIKDLLNYFQPDVCHIHSFKAEINGTFAAKECAIPTVYTPHVFPFMRRNGTVVDSFFKYFEAKMSACHKKIVCVSNSEYEAAVKADIAREKLAVIQNGLRPLNNPLSKEEARLKWGISLTERVVANRCRITPQKNIKLFFDVAKQVPQNMFLLWGSGNKKMLRSMPPNVRYMGIYDDINDVVNIPDVFLSTSSYEGMPYSVLESMQAGVKTVLTAVPGHTDFNNSKSAIIVPEDSYSLGKQVRELLNDNSVLSEYLLKNAKNYVEQLTVDSMRDKLYKIYLNI